MKIFYYCSTGTNTSLLAANYHLGIIKGSKLKNSDILKLPYYNSTTRDEIGQPYSIGVDKMGNEIFTFGVKEENILLTNALVDWLEVFNITVSEYKLVDLTEINKEYLVRTGIYVSTVMGLRNFGGLLGAYGLHKIFTRIEQIVDRVKSELT